MNKAIFLFAVASSISLAAAAANKAEETGVNGDPGKKNEKQTSFGLASGYFSLFTFLGPSTLPADTTHRPEAVAPLKAGASKE